MTVAGKISEAATALLSRKSYAMHTQSILKKLWGLQPSVQGDIKVLGLTATPEQACKPLWLLADHSGDVCKVPRLCLK